MELAQQQSTVKTVFTLLKFVFGIVPIVAGLDKMTNLLTNWEAYLPTGMVQMLPVSPSTFMIAIGLVEIAAGIIVLVRPAIGAYIVSLWLTLIAVTLIAGGHLDVAVRDLVMAASAFSLARLAKVVE